MTLFAVLATSFCVSLAVFGLLWPVSLIKRDASVVDFWWGPGFAVMVCVAGALNWPVAGVGLLMLGLVTVWGLRLGIVLGARRLREGGEDPRYADMRAAWGAAFWWKSLFIVFLLQGVLQFLVGLGALLTVAGPAAPVGALAGLGAGVAALGLWLETVSDREMDAYRRGGAVHGLFTGGLRAHVRHPSYLGEILFWWGLGLVALGAGVVWGLACAALMTLILIKVSGVVLMNERLAATRPGYGAYSATTPAVLPRGRSLWPMAQILFGRRMRGAAQSAQRG